MNDPALARRCWAEIDLEALRHNVAAARAHLCEGVRVMAVVKANAYGHGVLRVVRTLRDCVEMFGVANLAEALEITPLVAPSRIHILGPALAAERVGIVAHGFIPGISSVEEAAAYSALAAPGQRVPAHLILDTGMGRIGLWQDAALAALGPILQLPGLAINGLASHLPVADEDDTFTRDELAHFRSLASVLRAHGLDTPLDHIANSAGLIGFPARPGEMVRAGLMLYGSSPRPEFQSRLRPVLTWKSRVTLVRDVGPGRGISYGRTFLTPRSMRIATIAVGYADGYQRHLTGRSAEVLIGGQRCPVLGRITMDQIMADVTALPKLEAGEEVVLLGLQGDEEILASELAEKSGTIAWEIFTGLGARVERVYAEL